MLQEVTLHKLRYADYWRKPQEHWGVDTWTSFFCKNNTDTPPQMILTSLIAELKILINNLGSKTREIKKALALSRQLEISIFTHPYNVKKLISIVNMLYPVPLA